MNSVREIIDALGGPTEFGRICGFVKNPAARGSDMRQRESIPVTYWPRVIEAASATQQPITYETLVRVHQRPASAQPSAPEAA